MLRSGMYRVEHGSLAFYPREKADYSKMAALILGGSIDTFTRLEIHNANPDYDGLSELSHAIAQKNPSLRDLLLIGTKSEPYVNPEKFSQSVAPLIEETACARFSLLGPARGDMPPSFAGKVPLSPEVINVLAIKSEMESNIERLVHNYAGSKQDPLAAADRLYEAMSDREKAAFKLIVPVKYAEMDSHHPAKARLEKLLRLIPQGTDMTPTKTGLLALADRVKDLPNIHLTDEQLAKGGPLTIIGRMDERGRVVDITEPKMTK